ncbi:MAG: hypothetical protein JW888_18600, partial [Pirellulales bacterium]|nr:hypothetical protein [Pirellulales bacterium]
LVELAVVVIIIGVLAAFGVPKMLQAVERSKASEAFGYLAAVRGAQERYQAREGKYATSLADLDIQQVPPKYFDVLPDGDTIASNDEDEWSLQLQRKEGSSGYTQYTITFNQDGFDTDPANSTILTPPASDINPMGSEASAPAT